MEPASSCLYKAVLCLRMARSSTFPFRRFCDYFRSTHCHRHRRRVGITRHHGWHDRCVDNPDTFYATHSQLWVYDRTFIAAHSTCPGNVIGGLPELLIARKDLFIALH